MNKITNITFISIGILILLGVYAMLRITIPYLSFETDIGFLLTKQAVLHIDIWYISFYTHITSSVIVLLLGCLQFVKLIRVKLPHLHRNLGKFYIGFILGLSAPSGLIMGCYANGGIAAKLSFILTSLCWWIFTFKAYRAIRFNQVQSHINFMIRSYALTLSALTLRCYVMLLPLVIQLHAKEMYTLVAWLSWVPNLLLAEWFVKKQYFTFNQPKEKL
ncbi:MAG: DUF2306 domain-containing protein [Bacteroidetes bacterium]|nr:MAG: DUF2306 domain-containing protein [Bacteroidota bacterium]